MLMGQLERKLTKQVSDLRNDVRQVEGKKKFEVEELLRKEFYKQLQEHNKSQILRMQEAKDYVMKQVEAKLLEVDKRLDENDVKDQK